jgi:hypothetical protein
MEENATGGCRKFYNAKLPNLYPSSDMSMTKSREMSLFYYVFLSRFLLGSFLDSEDGTDMILRDAG